MIASNLPILRLASRDQPPRFDPRRSAASMIGIDLATHILVIEDEAMIAWMVESVLEDMGFTSIAVAATGEDAIEAAHGAVPGLVITDVNLGPGIDGIAAASAIQVRSGGAVILITGYGLTEATTRSVKMLPSVPILRKPLQVPELRNAIGRVLAGSETRN